MAVEERPTPKSIPIAGAGSTASAQVAQGNDGLLRSVGAIQQALNSFANEVSIITSRQERMGLPTIGAVPSGPSRQEITSAVREAVRESIPSGERKSPPQPTHRRIADPAMEEQSKPESDLEGAEPVRSRYDEFAERRDFFKDPRTGGFSLRNLRQKVGEAAMERAGNFEWGDQLHWTPHGWRDPQTGQFAGADRVASFLRKEKVVGAAREFTRGLASGQTLRQAGMGALPGSLARGAGWIGAGFMAANTVGDFLETQRAQNAEWQSILGGGQRDAIGQRIEQRLFGLSQFGVMDSEQAQAAFRSVSETGMVGEERSNALNFVMQNYRQLGMSVEESMELVRIAAETGTESLQGVAQSLRQVSESAVEAGVNAEKARKMFIGQYESLLSLTGSGVGSAQLASALTSASVGLGRDMAGYGINFDDPMYLSRLGATQFGGATFNQMLAMAGTFEGQMQLLQGAERLMQQDLSLMFTGGGLQRALSLIEQHRDPSTGQVPDSSIDTIVNELLADPNNGFIPAQRMPSVLQTLGLDAQDIRGSLRFVIRSLAGQYRPSQELAEQAKSMEAQQLDQRSVQAAQAVQFHGHRGSDRGFGKDTQFHEEARRAQDSVNRGFLNLGIGFLGADDEGQRVQEAYDAFMASTGMYGGIVGEIAGDSTIRSQIDKVKVMTPEGERIVDLWTAIEYYGDQVMRGDVSVVQGSAAGATLAEVAGQGFADSDFQVTSATEGPVKGQTIEDFQAELDKQRRRGEDVGTVVIGLTPDARRILNVQATGPVTIEDDWSTVTQHLSSNQLPSGNP